MEFPGVLANDDVSLDIRKGEVFALVGENGAGKSTLMNILYGIHEPTNGEVYIRGRKVERFSPKTAISMGVGMVHQHFMLVPSFTVAQNIVMSREPRRLGVLFDNKAAEAAAQKLVEEYGLVVDPAAVVREIGVGLQQRVEILKTLYRGADILILDEPTAVLTPQETDELFAVIRRVVRELGMTVIIITHKLYEVMAISDRVGVMRKGRLIGVENTCDVDEKKLASMMVGRPVLYDRLEKTGEAGAEQIRVSGLTVCDDRGLVAVDGLSLSVRAGEVLGIAAIEGNGQSELLEAITGMRRVERGTVEVCGQNVTEKTAGEIRKVGLSHIPEDRLATGVSRSASVTKPSAASRFISGAAPSSATQRRSMRGSTSAARASTPPSAPCPAAICRRSSSRVNFRLIPPCSSSPSPRAAWTWAPSNSSTPASSKSATPAVPFSSARPTSTRCFACPTASSRCTRGASPASSAQVTSPRRRSAGT